MHKESPIDWSKVAFSTHTSSPTWLVRVGRLCARGGGGRQRGFQTRLETNPIKTLELQR